jgi:hypothetical protein
MVGWLGGAGWPIEWLVCWFVGACSDTVLLEYVDAADLKVGEEVSLMNWGNIIVRAINTDGDKVASIDADLNPAVCRSSCAAASCHSVFTKRLLACGTQGSFKDTQKKLTWLSAEEKLLPCDLVEYDYLITVPKLGPDDELEKVVNPYISVLVCHVVVSSATR